MKYIRILPLLTLATLIASFTRVLKAQPPGQLGFHGEARDLGGNIIANSQITCKLAIHKGAPAGPIIVATTETVTTAADGTFEVQLGSEQSPVTFNVDWGASSMYLQMEIDPDGPANGYAYIDCGTTQLVSVPYAFNASSAGKWRDDTPVIQKGQFGASGPLLPSVDNGPRLIWYPRKAAFRAGQPTNFVWDENTIGLYSLASGYNTLADAPHSVAMGFFTSASFNNALAMGSKSKAISNGAVGIGNLAISSGMNAIAMGTGAYGDVNLSHAMGTEVSSRSQGGLVLGNYNDISDNPSAVSVDQTDRIFQIGNGTSANNRLNAVTVLRNGNIGIGSNVLLPAYVLDVGARPRIRHNASSAGVALNNSQNQESGFIGMMTDAEVGLQLNNAWKFWVNSSTAYVSGQVVQTSDRRLKTNLVPVTATVTRLRSLTGFHYQWIDPEKGTDVRTGLMAQDVEKLFPELVKTDEAGTKAINYSGLVPSLVEAIKEINEKTKEADALLLKLTGKQ